MTVHGPMYKVVWCAIYYTKLTIIMMELFEEVVFKIQLHMCTYGLVH